MLNTPRGGQKELKIRGAFATKRSRRKGPASLSFGSLRRLSIRWDNSPTVWLQRDQVRLRHGAGALTGDCEPWQRARDKFRASFGGEPKKSGGRQGGYSINPEKSVVFFCVFVFEYTGVFHIISKFCKVFAFLKIIFFSNEGEISYFFSVISHPLVGHDMPVQVFISSERDGAPQILQK